MLGLSWSPNRDIFPFTFNLKGIFLNYQVDQKFQRDVLTMIMSIFDALRISCMPNNQCQDIDPNVWINNIHWDQEKTKDIFEA